MTSNQPSPNNAIALEYNPEQDAAPRVIAIGKGHLADRIVSLARSHNIPIHHDPVLAETLSQVSFGEPIPPALYQVVAEILAYVYRISSRRGFP